MVLLINCNVPLLGLQIFQDCLKDFMNRLKFENLGNLIIHSLSVGIIAFSRNMEIIETNQKARELLSLEDKIDASLNSGTDHAIWGDWKDRLAKIVDYGSHGNFNTVKYVKNGTTKLLDISCVALKEEKSQRTLGGALVIEDATGRVEMERKLSASEKLAAIGKVSGKVAHELNNPMDGILRYINLSKRMIQTEQYQKSLEYLENSKNGLKRMSNVIRELLEFSRNTNSDTNFVKLENIISEALRTMSVHWEEINITITTDYDTDIKPVKSGGLFQVFCNLIKNAIDAMEQGGQLSIATSQDYDHIYISFTDTGHGIDDKYLENIFEPFFTTKQPGKGTGLGLAICNDIVSKYSGRITASRAPQGGSIFKVILPIKEVCTNN